MNRVSAIAASTLLTLWSVPAWSVPALAQSSERLLTSGCSQGNCWESYVIEQAILQQRYVEDDLTTLYRVETVMRSLQTASQPRTEWVQCSTRQPFVAFESPDRSSVTLQYVSPGVAATVDNENAHQLYWAICHNQWNANVRNPELGLAFLAFQLGYPPRLNQLEREVPIARFIPAQQ
ncbi:MAG TPA: hypothetical protein V6C88_18590 [Chroococcidiopsis sp.]